MTAVMIGLEVHCQLNTKTKLFCGCRNTTGEPNTFTCPTCLGLPGSKPALNKEVVKKAIRIAYALKCSIATETYFSRKSYFFPDLPNNFQITQFEIPIASSGEFMGKRIRRMHIEEDPGKLIHKEKYVLVDYNRSGVPLVEIVTEPDFTNAEEVKKFLNFLVTTLEYLGVYDRKSEATLRCDVNVSTNNGERVEVKNVNGSNEVLKVIGYEVVRQQHEKAVRETRSWDEEKQITYSSRKKEFEEEYGYILEPNLPKLVLAKEFLDDLAIDIPELVTDKIERFMAQYKLPRDDAEVLCSSLKLASLLEEVAKKVDPAFAAKVLRRDLVKFLADKGKSIEDINSSSITTVIRLFFEKKLTDKIAKDIIYKLVDEDFNVEEYVKEQNLIMIEDDSALEEVCKEVVENNRQVVNDYNTGNENAMNFLLGQVMKRTKGKASPEKCRSILKKIVSKV